MAAKIRLAVVIGGHHYDVPAFRAMLASLRNVDPYIQDVDNWARAHKDGGHAAYDAFLFYHMNYWGKLSVRDDMDQRITDAVAGMGETSQGIVVLHHALLSFTDMQPYSAMCNVLGRKIRAYGLADIRTRVVTTEHPITRGIRDWTLPDEYFLIDPPGEGSTLLLETDHPQSTRQLAWAHTYRNARVFCYQSGHGPSAYADRTWRDVMSRGVAWVAGRI